MRDLKADLELCEKATPGPWGAARVHYNDGDHLVQLFSDPADQYGHSNFGATNHDTAFIAAAREGWPEAIRRAMEAEAKAERLTGFLDTAWNMVESSTCNYCHHRHKRPKCIASCAVLELFMAIRKERGEAV